MTHGRGLTRPLPYLDDAPLQRLWSDNELSVGRTIGINGRAYRVVGCDPESVRPRRVYLEDIGSGRQHALVLSGKSDCR